MCDDYPCIERTRSVGVGRATTAAMKVTSPRRRCGVGARLHPGPDAIRDAFEPGVFEAHNGEQTYHAGFGSQI